MPCDPGCFVVPDVHIVPYVAPGGGLKTRIERTPWIIARGTEVWCCRGCRLLGSSHDMLWHRCEDFIARKDT